MQCSRMIAVMYRSNHIIGVSSHGNTRNVETCVYDSTTMSCPLVAWGLNSLRAPDASLLPLHVSEVTFLGNAGPETCHVHETVLATLVYKMGHAVVLGPLKNSSPSGSKME
jgi:hypothetical protein